MKTVLALFLAAGLLSAGRKHQAPAPQLPPLPPPTAEQMQQSYDFVAKWLCEHAKNPRSVEVDPIDTAKFERRRTRDGRDDGSVFVEIGFYGQNGFGATIHTVASCLARPDGYAFCMFF